MMTRFTKYWNHFNHGILLAASYRILSIQSSDISTANLFKLHPELEETETRICM